MTAGRDVRSIECVIAAAARFAARRRSHMGKFKHIADAIRSCGLFYVILQHLFSLYSANIAYPDCESWKTGPGALP